MGTYRDNYPYNIESPQRVYVQYSKDIIFDYSNGKYPLGETFEGFLWENTYVPIAHYIGDVLVGKHTWMRWRIGEKEAWTLPMRLTDSILNVEATEIEYETNPNQIKFKFKYTLDTGSIIYSEYMYIPLPQDGRGITNTQIVNNNLILTYTDGSFQNVGRIVGYDGTGVPIGTTNYNVLISLNDEPQWITLISQLNNNLSGLSPIDYTNGLISHISTDGNRHIPIGGNNTDCLSTDGSGNYSWVQRISYDAINDSAGIGDINELWSADKLSTMFASISAFGIKYSVELYADLALITGMEDNDLAVVTNDPLYPNRPVFKYINPSWNVFFDLDATHNHNDLYYTKTELNTSGAGGHVHWNNITNIPSSFSYEYWSVSDGLSVLDIERTDLLQFIGLNGTTVTLSGSDILIDSVEYSAGSGINIASGIISHSDTSSVANTTNLNGVVIQNLTFDTYGHVLTTSNLNLDTKYSLLTHTHAMLTNGLGLTGPDYNGSAAATWNVDFAGTGSADTVARSDHSHTTMATITTYILHLSSSSMACYFFKYDYGIHSFVTLRFRAYWGGGGLAISQDQLIGTISDINFRPQDTISFFATHYATNNSKRGTEINIYANGEIRIGTEGMTNVVCREIYSGITYPID